jgi:hypothetical protein
MCVCVEIKIGITSLLFFGSSLPDPGWLAGWPLGDSHPPLILAHSPTLFKKPTTKQKQRDDLHVNFYAIPTRIAHADPGLKQVVIDTVRPILEEWIGKVDTLDHTSTYGIRRYYNGSRCVWMGGGLWMGGWVAAWVE